MRLATVPSEKDDRRKALILAGRKLFAKRGLDGTTVRDIAAEAEASLCLISYHFGSKEGLYRACIEEFALGRMEVAKSILAPVSTTEEFKQRLKLFIDSLGASHLDQPDIQKILQRELDSGFPIAREVFEKTLLKLMRGLAEFFESAQKLGIIRADVPPALLLSLVYGSVWQMARLEWINKRYFDRAFMSVEERQNTFDMLFKILCDGFLAKDSLLSLI